MPSGARSADFERPSDAEGCPKGRFRSISCAPAKPKQARASNSTTPSRPKRYRAVNLQRPSEAKRAGVVDFECPNEDGLDRSMRACQRGRPRGIEAGNVSRCDDFGRPSKAEAVSSGPSASPQRSAGGSSGQFRASHERPSYAEPSPKCRFRAPQRCRARPEGSISGAPAEPSGLERPKNRKRSGRAS